MPIANTMLGKYVAKQVTAGVYAAPVQISELATVVPDHSSTPPEVNLLDPLAIGVAEDPVHPGESARPEVRTLLPERFQEGTFLIALVFAFAWGAIALGEWTGINAGVWALLLGLGGRAVGIPPDATLYKANAFGFVMPVIIMVVLASKATASWDSVVASFVPAMAVLIAAVVGIILFAGFASRLVGWDPLKGSPVGLTALFGFPADYMLCQEISRSLGKDELEEEASMNDIYTRMLIGGFTTVTLSSVVVASILCPLWRNAVLDKGSAPCLNMHPGIFHASPTQNPSFLLT